MSTAAIVTIPVLILFFALMVFVGLRYRKRAKSLDGFVLGGRTVGPWLTAFAFGTSYFSAVIFVGYAGQFGWNFGLASTWIGLGNAFLGSLLAWQVLGRRTRVMTQALDSRTMPDFFAKRYGSHALTVAASVIVFVFLIPYTASLYNGLSSLFNQVFHIPYAVVVIVMAVLTGVYVIFGGYMATAVNDFIQGLVMLVGIVAVIISVLNQNGGATNAITELSKIAVSGSEQEGAYTSFFGPQPLYLLFVVVLTSLGTWGLPQMVGKFYSIKDEDAIRKGTVISTFFAVVVAGGCYFLGGFGRLYDDPALYSAAGKLFSDRIVPSMLSTLAPAMIALVIVLVLSASMSTLSSLALTSASTLTLDLVVPAAKRRHPDAEKRSVLIIRIFIVFFVALSAVIAILKDTVFADSVFIAQMMGVSWGALAGSFLAPFLWGLYSRKISRAAVWTCFVYGSGLEILQLLVSMGVLPWGNTLLFRNSLYSGVFAMVGGLILVPLVSLFTKKSVPENAEEIFHCYDQKITTDVTDSLG